MLRIRWAMLGVAIVGGLSSCNSLSSQQVEHSAAVPIQNRDLRILVVADPHLDPFTNVSLVARLEHAPQNGWPFLLQTDSQAPFATVGYDANASLLFSAFATMQRFVPNPDVVLVAGDLLAHDFHQRFVRTASRIDDEAYHRFVDNTAAIFPYALHALYPQAQILPVVGNNDGYCGDYHSTPRDAFLKHQAAEWEPLANRHQTAPDFGKTYALGGYYEARLPNGVRLLGLNSIMFARSYENACGDPASSPARDELRWLHGQIHIPDQPPTLILTHIPPGVDGLKSFLHVGKPVLYYQDAAQKQLLAELSTPHTNFTAMITGHLHAIGYRILPVGESGAGEGATGDQAGGIPVYSAPAISPILGTTPSFAEIDLSPHGQIDNITVYQLDPTIFSSQTQPRWHRAYDINSRYGIRGVTAASIRALHGLEQSDLSVRHTVEHDRVGGGIAGAIGTISWRSAWCAEIAIEPTSYLDCEGIPKPVRGFSRFFQKLFGR